MASPFPGVDPYVEATHRWPDFHGSFITYLRDTLLDRVPDHYEVRIDERLSLTEIGCDDPSLFKPDVSVIRTRPQSGPPGPASGQGAAVAEPVLLPTLISDEFPETYVQVLHRQDHGVVTAIELLSPTNKSGGGRNDYLVKRNAVLKLPIHLVELDLLLGGQRLPMKKALPSADYFALVARAEDRPNCEVYAWSVRDPLPAVRVPLKAPDPDVELELGPLFTLTFERARYARHIDYSLPITLPMREESRLWVAEQVRRSV